MSYTGGAIFGEAPAHVRIVGMPLAMRMHTYRPMIGGEASCSHLVDEIKLENFVLDPDPESWREVVGGLLREACYRRTAYDELSDSFFQLPAGHSVHYNSHRGLIDDSGLLFLTPPRAFLAQQMPIGEVDLAIVDGDFKTGFRLDGRWKGREIEPIVVGDVTEKNWHVWVSPVQLFADAQSGTLVDESEPQICEACGMCTGPDPIKFRGTFLCFPCWRTGATLPSPSVPSPSPVPTPFPGDLKGPRELLPPSYQIPPPDGWGKIDRAIEKALERGRVRREVGYLHQSPFDPEELCADTKPPSAAIVLPFERGPLGFEWVPNPEWAKAPYEIDPRTGAIFARTLVNEIIGPEPFRSPREVGRNTSPSFRSYWWLQAGYG
jgi:hypothetical protein